MASAARFSAHTPAGRLARAARRAPAAGVGVGGLRVGVGGFCVGGFRVGVGGRSFDGGGALTTAGFACASARRSRRSELPADGGVATGTRLRERDGASVRGSCGRFAFASASASLRSSCAFQPDCSWSAASLNARRTASAERASSASSISARNAESATSCAAHLASRACFSLSTRWRRARFSASSVVSFSFACDALAFIVCTNDLTATSDG